MNFNGFRKNWQENLHRDYFTDRAMEKVTAGGHLTDSSTNSSLCDQLPELHVYKSATAAASAFNLKNPVVIVGLSGASEFGLVHTGNHFWPLSHIRFVCEDCHTWWFDLKLDSNDIEVEHRVKKEDIAHICLAIPKTFFEKNGEPVYYCVLESQWMELDSKLNFVFGYL